VNSGVRPVCPGVSWRYARDGTPRRCPRLERGNQTASVEDLSTWADLCGRSEAAEGLIAQRRSLETHYTSWRRRLSGGNQARQQNAVDLEHRSRSFRIFESVCIPGLLQTPAYARFMHVPGTQYRGRNLRCRSSGSDAWRPARCCRAWHGRESSR
jgi:hypothetical protein